jgi:peptide/nickel transport system substrate-binding protein
MLRSAKLLSLVVAILIFGSPVFFSPVSAAATPSQGTSCSPSDTLNMVLSGGAPSNFNFLAIHSESQAGTLRMMYLDLTPAPGLNGQGYEPNGVVDWITTNSNYTVWNFNVRPGLKWSDGTPVNASDILNTYGPGFAFNASYDYLNIHQTVVSERALNASEAQFVLNVSNAWFPTELSGIDFTAVYPSSFTSHGPAYNGFGTTLVGDGPFYGAPYSSGSTQFVMYRNPYFTPEPKVCEIIVNFVESTAQDPTYIAAGTDDFARLPGGSINSTLASNPHAQLDLLPGTSLTGLFYNDSQYPYSNLAFRQALAYSIDWNSIEQTNGGSPYATNSSCAQGEVSPYSAFYNSNQQCYSYNPTKAMQLLQSMGIKKGSDGYLQYSNGTDVSLSIYVADNYAANLPDASIMITSWTNLGFKAPQETVTTQGTITSYTFHNKNNIWSAMEFTQTSSTDFGSPYLDAQTAYFAVVPYRPPPYWMGCANCSAENDYNGNLTMLTSTANVGVVRQALNNIQALDAANLPAIYVDYPATTDAFNTAKFTNWNAQGMVLSEPDFWNMTAWAELSPVSGSTNSAPTSSTVTSSVTSANSGGSSTGTTTSAGTVSSSGSAAFTSYIVIAAVVVVIAVVAGILFIRSRRTTSSTP